MEEEISYEEAKKAKKVLLKYLKSRCSGCDGDDVWQKYRNEYLALIALGQDYFLD